MEYVPLSEKMRPTKLEDVVGQPHLTGPEGFITQLIKRKTPLSILLFGPPGSGKTSIAKLYAQAFDMRFVSLSAVWDGIGELKKIVKETLDNPLFGKSVLLFVDEIHRFNKAQQDAFLPFLKKEPLSLWGPQLKIPLFISIRPFSLAFVFYLLIPSMILLLLTCLRDMRKLLKRFRLPRGHAFF